MRSAACPVRTLAVLLGACVCAIPTLAAAAPPIASTTSASTIAPKPRPPKRVASTAPATASARSGARDAHCLKPAIEIVAATDVERLSLTRCDGGVAPLAIEKLSILMRPGGAPKPRLPASELAKTRGDKLAPSIRRIDAGLVLRLQKVIEHFSSPPPPSPSSTTAAPRKVWIVSGYRPSSKGSKHSEARALDFKVDGVTNEELVAFCKTLDDTGCGYYPNSTFVHMDVRDRGAGHVAWIDASGPGEAPRYVTSWPPPSSTTSSSAKPSDPVERDDHLENRFDPDTLPALPLPTTSDAP